MRVQVFTSPLCSHREAALEIVRESLMESGLESDVEEIEVLNFEHAKELRCFGSPTVRIDGVDVEYGNREPEEFTSGCRYYNTPEGWKPVAPKNAVTGAIARASKG